MLNFDKPNMFTVTLCWSYVAHRYTPSARIDRPHKTLGPKNLSTLSQKPVKSDQISTNLYTHFDKAVSLFDQPSQFDGDELKKAPSQWQPIDNFWVVKAVR